MSHLPAFECPSCHEIYGALGHAYCPPCGHVPCTYREDLVFLTDNNTHLKIGVFKKEELDKAEAEGGVLPEPVA